MLGKNINWFIGGSFANQTTSGLAVCLEEKNQTSNEHSK